MGKIVGYATVGMVLALAKKMAIQYGALGISDVRTTPDGSDLIFIMSDGSQHRVELNFSANGVDYDDSVTKFNVSNVQAAIEALFSELQTKQNTLTAGNGISIENDTISVADAGGLTVLTNSDFPLNADLLAKVKANPQNYCIKDTNTILYYDSQDLLFLYYNDLQVKKATVNNDVNLQQSRFQIEKLNGKLHPLIKHIIVFANTTTKVAGNTLTVVGIEDTTDDSVKTGTQIRKAITIRKWH